MVSTHSSAFEKMVEQFGRCLTPDSARMVADFRADSDLQARIDVLAERNAEGAISPEELDELEAYVSAASFLSIIQAQARRMLRELEAA